MPVAAELQGRRLPLQAPFGVCQIILDGFAGLMWTHFEGRGSARRDGSREGGLCSPTASVPRRVLGSHGRMALGCSACCTAAPMMGNLPSAAISQQLDPLAKKCHCPKHPFFSLLLQMFSLLLAAKQMGGCR